MPGQRRNESRALRAMTSIDDTAWKGYGLLMLTDQHSSEIDVDSSVATAPLRIDRKESTNY